MVDNSTLLAELKRCRPHSLTVKVAGREEVQRIKISPRRDKWRRAVDSLDQLEWTRIEMRDENDAIVGVITEEGDADEVAAAANATPEERFLTLMIQAQRLALESQAKMMAPLIDGYKELTSLFAVRMAALEKNYGKVIENAYEMAVLQGQMDSQGDDEGMEAAGKLLADLVKGKPKKNPKALKGKTDGNS